MEASEAVVVVFSQHANDPPQVAREMGLAVSKRLPLIPVRIADVMPTADMQYFLGVSHWFNAYPKRIETYLPQIVGSVHRVLADTESPWRKIRSRLPQGRRGQIAAAIAGAVLVALVTGYAMRPSEPDFMAALRSPLAGRWQTEITDAQGREKNCVLDVQDMGQAKFSDIWPMPFTGAQGAITVATGNTFTKMAMTEPCYSKAVRCMALPPPLARPHLETWSRVTHNMASSPGRW